MLFFTGVAIGVLVIALILWSVVRYRHRGREAPGPSAHQFRDNVRLELLYTAVPLVIVAVLFGLTVATQADVDHLERDPPLRVEVTGFQWGWRFHYPADGITVVGDANRPPTLVLPQGRTARLDLSAPDVIHSFFVREFLVKRDLIPGQRNEIDVTPTRTGRFGGVCAEFCGLDHGRMAFTVEVLDGPAFDVWRARGGRP